MEKIIVDQSVRMKLLLDEHWESIQILSKKLHEKNQIDISDIESVLGPRPGIARANFKEYKAFAI